MIKEIEHFQVNWIDGMKISKRHFIEMENAFKDELRDNFANSLNEFNYGIIPTEKNDGKGLDLEVLNIQGSNVRLRLNNCRAITPSGNRIEIVGSLKNVDVNFTIESENINKNSGNLVYDVILRVEPFLKSPIGLPNPNENPPRNPYSIPSYSINVIPTEQVNIDNLSVNYLKIGRIIGKGDEFSFDSTYIPPCSSVMSNQVLINAYKVLSEDVRNINNNCLRIIQKIYAKNQKSTLADNVKQMSMLLSKHITTNFYAFKILAPHQAPIFMFIEIIKIANLIFYSLESIPEKDKEELINYYTEWGDLNQGALETMINDVCFLEYDHNDIRNALAKVEKFLLNINNLFNKLNSLDLIGKKKDRDFIVKEETTNTKTQAKKGWSFLD
jgi:hypothetical protein